MKIVIMGAGGIGGFYGALLARAGREVTLVARGDHLAAMRQNGLTVIRDDGRFTVRPIRAVASPREAGPAGLVLLTTKAYDLESAARALAPMLGEDTLVLPLLNGLGIRGRLAPILGEARLLEGLTYLPANRPAPGEVNQPGEQRRLVFGEAPGAHPGEAPSPRCRKVLEVLRQAGINAEVAPDMQREIWSKFMLVNANGGLCAVSGATIFQAATLPGLRELYGENCREVEALARAKDIALHPDIVARTIELAATSPPENKPSMLQDLEAGKPLELEAHAGAVVALGRELGVPVPVNTMVYASLKHRAEGRAG